MPALIDAAMKPTTTTEVPRIVGKPLATGVFWAWGIGLLVVILVAGWYVGRRTRDRA